MSEVSERVAPSDPRVGTPPPDLLPGTVVPAVRLWGPQTWISLAVTVGVFVAIFLLADLDLAAVWRELTEVQPGWALLGGLAHYATYPVRGMRWRRCVGHLSPAAGSGRFALIVFFYNAVDNVVPAKLGDLYAAHLVWINLGIRRAAALGSLVFVRMVDAWVVLGLAALSSWLLFADHLPDSVFWVLVFGLAIAVVATAALLLFVRWKRAVPDWVPASVAARIRSFQTGMWPPRGELVPVAVLTAVIWALETVWMLGLAHAFGVALDFESVLFLTMIPLLASTVPITPSGAGVVEMTLFGCATALGIGASVAASLTVLNRLIDYWLHIVLGLLTWAVRRRLGLRTWREVPLESPPAGA